MELGVRPLDEDDRTWVADHLERNWAGPLMISRGREYDVTALPGLVAVDGDRTVGLLTYASGADECEVVSLDAFEPGRGVGRRLVEALLEQLEPGTRLVVVTTNDNLDALGFYQRIGFALVEVRPGVVEETRRRKPGIPLLAGNGIPIRDELVLSMTAGS